MNFSDTYKKLLLAGVFLVMLIPMIQDNLNLKHVYPLKGDISLPNNIAFDKNDWFDAYYQTQKEHYLNSSFGFRNQFVKLHNQIAFSLFGKINAQAVVMGKEGYLFEKSYIDAYTGKDFLGEDSIQHTLNRLKFISDTLQKLNKHLIIVFAAGKASFYPEFIPDKYLPAKIQTNYNALSAGAKALNLNVIDFNKWFMQNKHKSKYPLYPQHGIHWSTYGTALAADSIIKKIEELQKIDAPEFTFNEVTLEQPHDVDYDIADGMNLFFKFKSFDVAYPKMLPVVYEGKTKPKVLVISDSFYWGMYNLGIASCFENDHFWYYNKQVYPESSSQELLVENLNLGEELNKHDVFIIMATEATLRKISWGFIENAESYFKGNYIQKKKNINNPQQVNNFIDFIKNDKVWMDTVRVRAKQKKISIDSMLVIEAQWQVQQLPE